ncbi:MAG: ATP-dependent zinc metalloprotease FtsH [Chloroflexota bacterium]
MRRFLLKYKVILALGIAVLVIVAGLALAVSAQSAQVPVVGISEVLNRAERGEIEKATITGNLVTITDQNGAKYMAIKEADAPVAEALRKGGAEVFVNEPQASAAPALLLVIPLLGIVALVWYVGGRGGLQNPALSFGQSRARLSMDADTGVCFSDVAGVEEAKTELSEIVYFLRYPERFRAMGARIPKGVLLVGAPGTGKTLIAKAVAGEANVPFINISGSEFVEMFVGVGASRVRDLFRQAKRHAPCIIFVDEIDAVGRQRGVAHTGANEEREQTLNQLLVEMDGFDSQAGIVVLGATNRPDVLDKALLRPGRFDRQVILDPPDIAGRKAILEVHARGKPLAHDVDLRALAQQTPGFSGADLANLLNEAAILAARSGKDAIGQAELEESILRVMAGPERKSRILSNEEKRITAYHEVGHAMVMRMVPNSDPVHKVSIISRGQALGMTVQRPKEDRYLMSKSQLMARMAGAMGGRAAEEIIFGEITTGARQDIEYATEIARRMVCEFGMSELGPVAFGCRDNGAGDTGWGDAIASKVDRAVVDLVEEAHVTALRTLSEHKTKLVEIAEHLIQVETIDASTLDSMLFNQSASA